jgi:hypothetical protein
MDPFDEIATVPSLEDHGGHEDRITMLGLMLKRSEHARLTALAHAQGHPTMSAFVRTRLPEIFLGEIAREGRKPGFSPKKKTA